MTAEPQHVCAIGACNNVATYVLDGYRVCFTHNGTGIHVQGLSGLKPRAQRVQPTPAQAMEAATTVFDGAPADRVTQRITEIADDLCGLQIPGTSPVEMLDAIEGLANRWRIAAGQNERAAIQANEGADQMQAEVESIRTDARMADCRWGQRLKAMDLRIERAVAILHGRHMEHVPVLDADLPFLSDAAHAAPVEGLAGVTVGACASLIEALMPVVAGKASINSRADAIAGVSLMTAQLALLCIADDYRSEYEFHLQMLRERHAKATESEMPF